MTALYQNDPAMLAWWGSEVECASALARVERAGGLTTEATAQAFERLDALAGAWHEVQPTSPVRATARRLVRGHELRAADALQLAAALAASEGHPASVELASLDRRLVDAARREGLAITMLDTR